MKRSELKRTGPIRRKRRRKANPAVLAEYAETHEACACCGVNAGTWGSWLETHHIFGGAMRVDIAANLIRLCKVCHDRATANKLTRAHCLWLKREMNEYEPEVLQTMLKRFGNRRLPDPVAPPNQWRTP